MRTLRRLIATSFFIVCGFTLSSAQVPEFELTTGRVGEVYLQSINKILDQKYHLKLETGVQGAAFQWVAVENLPAGLRLNSDGTITGVPQLHQGQPYRFKAKVIDSSIPDAEALELSFSIQMLPPRIKLVSSNAPKLVPSYSAPEQSSLPAGSTSVASGKGDASGDNASIPVQSVADAEMNRATRFASSTPVQGGNDIQPTNAAINAAQTNPTPSPTPQEIVITPAADAVSKYISIREDTGDTSTKNLHKGVLYKQVSFHNTRSFADRKSTIIIQLAGTPPSGDKFLVTAALTGGNPVDIDGLSTSTLQSGDQINATLTADSPATINLRKANARKGDELTITIRRIKLTNNASSVEVEKAFTIELDDYGFDQGVSPSIFLLSRPGVSDSDVPAGLKPGTLQDTDLISNLPTTNIPNAVNYSPSPGLNYTFSFKPKPDKEGPQWKFLSLLEPGVGVNATLMDFNDQTLSFTDLSQKFLTNQGSDVQLGVGGALSFLGNSVQLTYGANLNAENRRGYFAFGINFLKLLSLVRQ